MPCAIRPQFYGKPVVYMQVRGGWHAEMTSELAMAERQPNETEAWLDQLDDHAMEHGFHARLGARHGALYTEDDEEMLLVTFEEADAIREDADNPLPIGLKLAGKNGWSHLCIYSEGTTWFRDSEVYAFFDDLVDDGFFDMFDEVLFHGAGPEGYAAAAFSVSAPGAKVLAVRPQATLDPAQAGWDKRYPEARRLDFSSRYGYAPLMMEGAEDGIVVYDSAVAEDAMHAALFGTGVTHLRTPNLGWRTEKELDDMGILDPMMRAAARGRLDGAEFARLYRKRRRHPSYLRHVLTRLEEAERPFLAGLWCRAVLQEVDRPRFRKGLSDAEARLASEGRSLPAPLDEIRTNGPRSEAG